MIQVAPGTKVYLATRPVSMRFGFDGLAGQVANVLQADPYSGHVFIFRSKCAEYLKILYWDDFRAQLAVLRQAGSAAHRRSSTRRSSSSSC